ncbi:heparinase II/III family protein [Acuticoccus sp.]|uniref:heparinase II/III family protein n=1 Tax=Acuticoccus sp. TaxID=1904378 RepID=UPI003B524453
MSQLDAKPTTRRTLLAYALRRAGERIAGALGPARWRRPRSVTPQRVLFAPETLASADPTVAADIYAGVFVLAGEVVDAGGRSPFAVPPPSSAWAEALHGFSWLHHLEANATALSSSNARALVDEWFAVETRGGVAQAPAVAAERLGNWLVQSPLLINGADPDFRERHLRGLGRHMRRLERALPAMPHGSARLKVAATLATAGAVLTGEARLMGWALGQVALSLEHDVLPDGGHASRRPDALVDALAVLIPLREALRRRQVAVPGPLSDAIDRMMPMVRFFRHGDGGLAAFHGAAPVCPSDLEVLFAFDDVAARPPTNARHVGFQRLAAGRSVVLLDTGRPPPPPYADRAHASPLAFEFSHGATRLVVSCGALGLARPAWSDAARATAAQSTLTVADTSCASFVSRWPLARWLGPAIYDGPSTVSVERDRLAVAASHDGYRARFGLVHTRRVVLSSDGLWLDGEDRLVGQDRRDGLPAAIRFHLGPTVRARLEKGRRRALLTLPDGAIWMFGVDAGPPLALEDSVCLGEDRRVRRTTQLVIAADTLTDAPVRWHIAEHAKPLADPSEEIP